MMAAVVGTVALAAACPLQVVACIAAADRSPWSVWLVLASFACGGVGVLALWL